MTVSATTAFDPQRFFNLRSMSELPVHRLDTRVSGMAVSNDFSGRFSVTTAEGDSIILTADLESDFRSLSYASHADADPTARNIEAKYTHSSIQRNFGVTVNGDLNEEERQDLETLFQKVSNIFRGFFQGRGEEAKVDTAKLAEGFSVLDSLSSLDLTVEAVRSIAVVAASSSTPGGAPVTVAAIPQPSNGTTAPTPPANLVDGNHLNVPVKDAQLASLIQQVLDALKKAKVESENIHTYLPDFLRTLREDLVSELRGGRELKDNEYERSAAHRPDEIIPSVAMSRLSVAYQSVTEAAISSPIRS